jgi:hypothetical protein
VSDPAHAEPCAAALERSGPSDAMKPSPSKTWRGWRADVRRPHRAAGMESPDARKTRRGGRTNVGNSDARAMELSGAAKPVKTAAASKAGRDRRPDVRKAGAVKLMKIAAAKAAVEAVADKSGGDSRGSGPEIGRGMNAAGAKATKTWTVEGLKGRSTASSQTDRRRSAANA